MEKPVLRESDFERRPPAEKMPQRYDLKRVPPEGFSNIICLSHDVVGTRVHFVGGRTTPCLGKDCRADHSKCRIDWRGYLFFWSPAKQKIACVEITPAAMHPIDQAFKEYRSLRGVKMSFQRIGGKINSRLSCQCFAPAKDLSSLPDAPKLRKFLCRVWGVEYFRDNQQVTDEMLKLRVADDQTGAA